MRTGSGKADMACRASWVIGIEHRFDRIITLHRAGDRCCDPFAGDIRQLLIHQLRLIVEIKGYRREDAKEKKSTMDTYWIPGVNNLRSYGRWAFAEFTDVYQIEADFEEKVEEEFNKMIERALNGEVLNPE